MPDTNLPSSQPDALHRLLDSVLAGNDVTLFIRSDDGRELLDVAAERLAMCRCRVFRAAGTSSEGLSLPVLMAQVIGQPAPGVHNDEALKRGFQALTTLDATCDRIVLLVSDANTLQPAVLRYIQLACKAGTTLQLVLAGKRGFLELLSPHEFAPLRARLATGPIITPLSPIPTVAPAAPVAAPVAPPVALQRPSPMQDLPVAPAPRQIGPQPGRPMLSSPAHLPRRKRLAALASIGLGLAAGIAFAVWPGGNGEPAVPGQQAMLAVELPVVPDAAVAVAPEPQAMPAEVPAAVPEVVQPPAPTTAPSVSVAPPVAAPPLASPLSPPLIPPKNATRKAVAAQQRSVANRTPALNAGSVAAWEDPYPPLPREWRPLPPQQAVSDVPDQPKSYIGTYTTDANGVRAFHFGH